MPSFESGLILLARMVSAQPMAGLGYELPVIAAAAIGGTSLMVDLALQGVGILMISSDLLEVLAMSDRILVMHEGQLTGDFDREEATEELIMLAATGSELPAGAGRPAR